MWPLHCLLSFLSTWQLEFKPNLQKTGSGSCQFPKAQGPETGMVSFLLLIKQSESSLEEIYTTLLNWSHDKNLWTVYTMPSSKT